MTYKELRSTTACSQAHEFVHTKYGDTSLERALVYFLELTSDVQNGDRALFVCGQIREACAMLLSATGEAPSS
jgi:hypothetical protein